MSGLELLHGFVHSFVDFKPELKCDSVDPMENVNDVHKAFLGNGIYILEALNLSGVKPGNYDLICLPLRIENGDAGPCRVILKKKKASR